MIINELFDQPLAKKPELGYDLKDDLAFFMNNDPEFYRKKYFPTMLKFKKYCDQGKSVNPSGFAKLVTDAYEIYKEKFPVEGLEDKLQKETCMEVCKMIHQQESKNIEEGFYED
jgi:hypothetical protein